MFHVTMIGRLVCPKFQKLSDVPCGRSLMIVTAEKNIFSTNNKLNIHF
jgi:hypothetical protein